MPRRISNNVLNASTVDILNVIRKNASYEYQSSVPEIKKATEIPKVGEVIYGHPALANTFINALVNRVAFTAIQSATFNNMYAVLKKGYLEYGETVEEIFISIAKAIFLDVDKADEREFKRTLPDVNTAFHAINWKVIYPVTIQDEDLRQAFLSADGVLSMIAGIVDQVYTAAEYDEYLLFKYLLIKAISHGKMFPVSVGDADTPSEAAIQFRAFSNLLPISMSKDYNEFGVRNTTPKSRQVIFMDTFYNATFDVNVLAGAFNMDKANFMGRLFMIDSWTEFDNERFDVIRSQSDGIEEVTAAELAIMKNVKAVLMDDRWFQVYDNKNKFTEKYVASGDYWNYFYHVWKTISHSPFSNAVVFVTDGAAISAPATLTVTILSRDTGAEATTLTFSAETADATLAPNTYSFIQTEALTEAGIAVHPYGGVIIPASAETTNITLVAQVGDTLYTAGSAITGASTVGTTVTLTAASAPSAALDMDYIMGRK